MQKPTSLPGRLAVCSWSLQTEEPAELITRITATGIRNVQLALDPLRENPVRWSNIEKLFDKNNITIVSGMLRCEGEDYTTLESIKRTGGIAPDATWEKNLKNFHACAAIASNLGLKLVTLHAGFVPHKSDANFPKLKKRLETVAALLADRGLSLGLETGQETAAELAELMRTLQSSGVTNIGVNFDPANMILYAKGDPVEALGTLAPWLWQIHIKDATRTQTPGTWGEEVCVGRGDVDWRGFFARLQSLQYAFDFAIEREAGGQRVADIRTARDFVAKYI